MARQFSLRLLIKKNSFGFIAFLIASLAGLTVFSLSYMIATRVEDEVVEDFVAAGLSVNGSITHRVAYFFRGIGHELQQLSGLREIQVLGGDVQESEIFEVTFLGMKDYVASLRRLDRDGNLIFGYQGECEPIQNAQPEGDQDYFQKILSRKKQVVSEPFLDSDGERRVTVGYPIFLDNEEGREEFNGAITADIRIDAIKPLSTSPFDANERRWKHIAWFAPDDRVISFPDHPILESQDNIKGKMNCIDCHSFSKDFLNTNRRGQGWDVVHDFEGRKMIVLYSPVKLADQIWVVGLYADYNYVVREAREIGKYAKLVSVLSILIILLGSVVSLSLIKARRESDRKEKEIEHERELLRKVKESEEKYRDLFEGVRSGVYISTPEGKFKEVNREMVNMLGYKSKKDLLQIDIRNELYGDPEERIKFVDAIDKDGVVKDYESRLLKKDGSRITCLETSHGRRDESGRIVEYLGMLVDISEIKRKEKEIQSKNEELNTLNEVSKVISRSLVLDEILDLSLWKTLEVTPFDAGTIYLYDEVSEILNLEAVVGLPREVSEKIDTIPMGESLTGEIARDRKMILLDSLSEDSCSIAAKAGFELKSYIGLPILYGDRLMGVMNLASHAGLPRQDFKVDLLRGVAELIGIAMSNAHLYSRTQQIAKEMKVLYESGKSFMAVTDKDQLAGMVVEMASSELGYNACTLFDLDEENQELSILSTSCRAEAKLGKKTVSVDTGGVVNRVIKRRELCYLPDVANDPGYQPGWLEKGSELTIPLLVGEKLLGVIDFEREEINGFSPDGIRFLSLFANQVAWALDNVKLFEEIRKANEDLNRVSELKTQFVSLVSHELRTPMTAIKGSLDIIHSGAAGNVHDKQKMFISMARRNIDRLSDLINNILDLSRIEAGKIDFNFNEIDFQTPLNNVLLTLAGSAEEKKITLESQIPSSLPTLYADEAKVEQILTNLIANALKCTPSGGRVIVMAVRAGEEDLKRVPNGKNRPGESDRFVKISVHDTGSGIPRDQLKVIFDRYLQLQGKKGERGTGLGLTICRYLVDGQGGAIWAERGAERGSVLNFLLPEFQRCRARGINREYPIKDRKE